MKSFLFISGMFRSGTTLLGRLLNAHREIGIATDPYLYFFKSFRNKIAKIHKIKVDPDEPLNDYYFSIEQLTLFNEIQNTSFDIAFNSSNIDKFRKEIYSGGINYSPLIMPHLDEITGKTYKELFNSMLGLLSKHYGDDDHKIIGFKEVWTDEFIAPMARTFPESKFIQIIRDPRAVCASKKASSRAYPWLFLARQWRKLAALAWSYQQRNWDFSQRVLLVKYENLIRNPKKIAKNICKFLEIDFDQQMTNPRNFVDGRGEKWLQNTSFGNGKREFDTDSINKWQDTLTDYEIGYIESLCGPEMKLHGYEPQEDIKKISPEFILSPPKVFNKDLANWIKRYVQNDSVNVSLQTAQEQIRYELLNYKDTQSVDKQLIETCYLFCKLFMKLAG